MLHIPEKIYEVCLSTYFVPPLYTNLYDYSIIWYKTKREHRKKYHSVYTLWQSNKEIHNQTLVNGILSNNLFLIFHCKTQLQYLLHKIPLVFPTVQDDMS